MDAIKEFSLGSWIGPDPHFKRCVSPCYSRGWA
jgi:hypothetical protein